MSDTHPPARLEDITPELADNPHSCPLPTSAMTTAERVISIPHIRAGIIASLDDTGLHTAALVNKEWFSEVAPHLYSKLEVQLTDHHPTPDLKLHFVPKLPWPLEQLCSAARRVPGGEEEISDGLAWARQAAHRAVRCVMLPEHEYAGCDHYGEYDKLNPAIDKHQGKSAVLRIPRLEMYGHHYPIDCPVARMLDPAVMYLRVAEPRSRSIVPLSVSRQPLNDASAELHHNKAMCGKAVVDWNMEDSSSWFAFRGRVHAKVVVLFLPRFTPIPAPTSDTFENARHVEFVAIRICRLVRQCEFEQLILLNVADLEKYYQEHAKAPLGSRAMSGRLQQGFEDYVYYSLAKSGTDEVLARNTIRFMTTDQYRASAIWGEEDEAMLMRGEVRQPYESGK